MLSNHNQIEKPVRCFVTFEYTDAHNIFIQMVNDQKNNKNEKDFEAKTASLPTNIIWEDRNLSLG